MARDYGKIFTAAWGDPAFRSLSLGAQHLYMQLVSQPDTTMAGVLTTAPPRWAGQTEGSTPASVQAALDELEAARFVVSDPETMETLVRAFVRRDLGWRSPKTMIGIDSSIRAILSTRLKATIAAELGRCDTSTLSDAVSDRTGRSSREVVEGLIAALRRDYPNTPSDVAGSDRDTPSDTPSEGVADREYRSSLTATATEPATANATANAPALDVPVETPRKRGGAKPKAYVYPDAFEAFWAVYPRKDDKAKALEIWRSVTAKGVSNDDLIAAAERYRDDPNREAAFTKLPTSWLNAGAWGNGPLPPRGSASGRPQAGDTHAAMRRSHTAAQAYRALEDAGYYDTPQIKPQLRRTA